VPRGSGLGWRVVSSRNILSARRRLQAKATGRRLVRFAGENRVPITDKRRCLSQLPGALRTQLSKPKTPLLQVFYGASRTRTGDLLGAIQALSQLSYSPARVTV
jgi:hypothetical protein